ncbi:MAG: AAA family ATPase, partial [Pyrinomonadaceae bacterium]
MTFSLHESISPHDEYEGSEHSFYSVSVESDNAKQEMHILQDKLRIPGTDALIRRSRIDALLAKSVSQFPATLVSGRAGTGKTSIAANFASNFNKVAWYSVESTDISWPAFSRYFSASLPGVSGQCCNSDLKKDHEVGQAEIARYMVKNFSGYYTGGGSETTLIVLDDIHHIFDAVWFDDFFNLLLYSLPPSTHLLLLCRSKPPSPLWRLRSKQMLNVLDERVIAFNLA